MINNAINETKCIILYLTRMLKPETSQCSRYLALSQKIVEPPARALASATLDKLLNVLQSVKGTNTTNNSRQNIRQCRNGSFLLVSNDGVLRLLNGGMNTLHKRAKSCPSLLILISKDDG